MIIATIQLYYNIIFCTYNKCINCINACEIQSLSRTIFFIASYCNQCSLNIINNKKKNY